MAQKHSHPPDDLDKTDRLPVLDVAMLESNPDFEDDAVRLDQTAILPPNSFVATQVAQSDFARSSGVDLPSLAESVRSVEERIARQSAEFEALTRSYERVRDAESASAERATALAADLAAARAALESEQARSRQLDKTVAERIASTETDRARVEEALRDSERHQTESRTLRDAMAARDATIAQVLHSLGERDAQLAALNAEHEKLVPQLEARSKTGSQLAADLQATRAHAIAVAAELAASEEAVASLNAQLKRSEGAVSATRSELGSAMMQASSHLELLQTREWRNGFDLNMFRELDAQVGAAHVDQSVLASERDRLTSQVAALESKLAAGIEALDKLQTAATANTKTLAQQSNDLKRAEENRAKLSTQLATADAEVARLNAELAARERALMEANAAGSGEAKRVTELTAAAKQRLIEHEAQLAELHSGHAAQMAELHTGHAAQMAELQSQAESREQEMSLLRADLQEARQPIELIEAEVSRLSAELALKTSAFDELTEEHQKVRSALERTRGALEEREFLIRRLERSESNNANVLGRIQTSIERLGAASPTATAGGTATGGGAASASDWSAELIRVDGERPTTHVLSRRTRIGRAQGCELHIDSTSVSRHHALILVGPRDCIIEDLNSTNGILVNGRKVARQLLHDGDSVTIGDVQFRYCARATVHTAEPRVTLPPPSGF
jgi:chromosome segregation ATPase